MCFHVKTEFSHSDVRIKFKDIKIIQNFGSTPDVYPGGKLPVILKKDSLILDKFIWGLIPPRAKDKKIRKKLFNARVETVHTKPSFQESFLSRRCAVLVSGFYERGSDRKEHLFRPKNKKFLTLAGLWSNWANQEESINTCTILTKPADKIVKKIHPRMPLILNDDSLNKWLEEKNIYKIFKILKE